MLIEGWIPSPFKIEPTNQDLAHKRSNNPKTPNTLPCPHFLFATSASLCGWVVAQLMK